MKLVCFIASTLLIVLISQHSTNGLPIDDVTTQHSCLEGWELLDGECRPILSSSQKSHRLSKSSEVEGITLPNEVATEENEHHDRPSSCPEGKILGGNGRCKDILFGDQLATTVESKKLDKTPIEHEKETLDHTVEPTEDEHKEKLQKDKLPEGEKETLDHTTESYEGNRKSNVLTDDSESSGGNSESFKTPKGCPPGTKADEQGACQDEVEHTSTTLTMNFKSLLPADGSCPSGMEVFKGKCVYIKSKQDALTQDTNDVEEDKNDKTNVEDKLVPMLKGGSCPPNTEYSSNGLCRVRTVPTVAKILTNKEICRADEVLIDGKCQTKEIKLTKSTTIAPETEVDMENKVESQPKKHTVSP